MCRRRQRALPQTCYYLAQSYLGNLLLLPQLGKPGLGRVCNVWKQETGECAQENITDLLHADNGRLQLREDLRSGVYVDRLTEEVVMSGDSLNPITTSQASCSAQHVVEKCSSSALQ